MTSAGNGQTLLGGSRGEQCARSAEENAVQFATAELIEQMPAQSDSAASTAGAACMDVLGFGIENQHAAIQEFSGQADALSSG